MTKTLLRFVGNPAASLEAGIPCLFVSGSGVTCINLPLLTVFSSTLLSEFSLCFGASWDIKVVASLTSLILVSLLTLFASNLSSFSSHESSI